MPIGEFLRVKRDQLMTDEYSVRVLSQALVLIDARAKDIPDSTPVSELPQRMIQLELPSSLSKRTDSNSMAQHDRLQEGRGVTLGGSQTQQPRMCFVLYLFIFLACFIQSPFLFRSIHKLLILSDSHSFQQGSSQGGP